MSGAGRVVVGMSGGVDSFVAAMLLRRSGYEVIGVCLQLWGGERDGGVERLCRAAGIPLEYHDGCRLLETEVVEPFVREYAAGRTPSPCCLCNRGVKWRLLAEVADRCGAERVATGHYVGIVEEGGNCYFRRGRDGVKDQSYFLWGVPQAVLRRALTPLGDYTKEEVKALAVELGYPEVARKRESMGVCFLAGRNYRDFVVERTGMACREGEVRDRQGRLIGRHPGVLNYTVGQKQGVPPAGGEAMYVAEIRAAENLVVADRKAGLWRGELFVEQLAMVCPADLFGEGVSVRIRGLGLNPGGYIRAERLAGEEGVLVRLAEPAWAVAPGQPVAFYRGDVLLGGGIVGR